MKGIIIVLGAPNDNEGNLSDIALERCKQALKEYEKHNDYYILLTGGYGKHFNNTNKLHAYYTYSFLNKNGIPKDKFLEFVESSNTVEDIKLSKPVIKKYKPGDIIVITSDFHYNRAKFLFEKEMPDKKVDFSLSETNKKHSELEKLFEHEKKALQRLKLSYNE